MSKRPHRKRHFHPVTLLLVVLFTTVGAIAASHCQFVTPAQPPESPAATPDTEIEAETTPEASPVTHETRRENCYTILVSGADDGNQKYDTNILVLLDTDAGTIRGVSIPRDTKAIWDNKSHKINAAYTANGMDLLAMVVSEQLGIPVDYTIELELSGFVKLVDAIGGVDFDVPVHMYYDDPTQNLSIHFMPGMQHLSGEEAIKVVRFRHNNDGTGYGSEDMGRMQTQQNFIKAVAQQTLSLDNLGKIPKIARVAKESIRADKLSVSNLIWLGKELISIGPDNIELSTLPGVWKSPFIYLDPAAVLEVVNTQLNPYVEPRTAEDLHIPT